MADQTAWDQRQGATRARAGSHRRRRTVRRRRRHAVEAASGFGIILIAIGLVFLVGQFVPGVAWWNLWPLFIVVWSASSRWSRRTRETGGACQRIMDGIGTVILGLVLLGNTTGFISWSVWWTLLTLWPVLLIVDRPVGSRQGRSDQSWMRASGAGPDLGWRSPTRSRPRSPASAASPHVRTRSLRPRRRAVRASASRSAVRPTATLAFKGGAATSRSTADSRDLVRRAAPRRSVTPELLGDAQGRHADVNFALGRVDERCHGPGFAAGSVDVALSDAVLWDATLETGATSLDADLSERASAAR